jgi:hypothetical protein
MKIRLIDNLPPEDLAMLQALYSRSAASVDTHLEKVQASGSGKFMDNYVVGSLGRVLEKRTGEGERRMNSIEQRLRWPTVRPDGAKEASARFEYQLAVEREWVQLMKRTTERDRRKARRNGGLIGWIALAGLCVFALIVAACPLQGVASA